MILLDMIFELMNLILDKVILIKLKNRRLHKYCYFFAQPPPAS